jgi:hypothetical protein
MSTPLPMVADLVHFCVVLLLAPNGALSDFRLVANDACQTMRCRAACFRDVTLSYGLNRRIVL